MGVYLDGDLYVTGRRADLIVINGSHHYPQDIEGTTEEASPMVRRGHVTVFTVPAADSADADERLVIVTERAPGTGRADPAPAVEAIRVAVLDRHGIAASDVRFVAAGSIPRTTSGKLVRGACRAAYVIGVWR